MNRKYKIDNNNYADLFSLRTMNFNILGVILNMYWMNLFLRLLSNIFFFFILYCYKIYLECKLLKWSIVTKSANNRLPFLISKEREIVKLFYNSNSTYNYVITNAYTYNWNIRYLIIKFLLTNRLLVSVLRIFKIVAPCGFYYLSCINFNLNRNFWRKLDLRLCISCLKPSNSLSTTSV